MNRQDILQSFFELIKDSLEWGIDAEYYGMYVDGCAAMTDRLLDKLETKDYSKPINENVFANLPNLYSKM